MLRLTSFLPLLSFLAKGYGAAIQQPLPIHGSDASVDLLAALEKLNEAVGGRLRKLDPVAKSCYSPSNETQCKILQENRTSDIFVTNQPAGYYHSNWASCQTSGEMCAMPGQESSYYISPTSRCHQGNVPDFYIDVESAADVQEAFKHVTDLNKSIVIKNTGHDWKGRSAGANSIALWTHNLRNESRVPIRLEKSFVPDGCVNESKGETVLTFGAGETWRGLYEFAEKVNLTVIGGTCGTVGVAGWLHGGGHSPLTPTFGMGVDNVRQIKIVLPTGKEKIANRCQNQELFRAVKGGGGGTFGVVMEVSYKALDKFELQGFEISLPGLDSTATRHLFDILTGNAVSWSKQGWGGYINTNRVYRTVTLINPRISLETARKDMAELIQFGRDQNVEATLETHSSWYAYYHKYFTKPEYHVAAWGKVVSSRLIPPNVLNDADSRRVLVGRLLELHYSNVNFVLMPVTPTYFHSTSESSLHPTWRNATWLIRINDQWDPFYQAATPRTNNRLFEKIHKAMDPIRALTPGMGVSMNEADIWEDDHTEAFWGRENHARLVELKKEVDPKNILSVFQGVGSDKRDQRFKCYPQQP